MLLKRAFFMTTVCLSAIAMAAPSEIIAPNKIGWSLYRAQSASKENVFVSPSSLYVALSLTFEGSQGGTREQARKFLGWPSPQGRPPLVDHLKKMGSSSDVQLIMANAIWTDSKALGMTAPTKEFESLARKVYQGDIRSASFHPPQKVTDEINAWAKKQTKDLIKLIVTPADLTGQTAALLNAIYFKGQWESRFDKKSTSSGKFFTPNGELVRSFMDQTKDFRYFQNEEIQIVCLPYLGGNMAMNLILPAEGKNIEDIEEGLSAEKLDSLLKNLKKEKVHVRIPKFEIKWGVKNLREDLVKIGMPISGDFTPLGAKQFDITGVLHKTVIKVDEEGTEAAAMTAVTGRSFGRLQEPKQFVVNRPFFFVIGDLTEGHWHFIGRVLAP